MPNITTDTVPSAPTQQAILKQFQTIPGVGKSIALDLWNQGFRSVEELKGQDPEEMYVRQSELQGAPVDRCMLYVFRCAVYYASNEEFPGEPGGKEWSA